MTLNSRHVSKMIWQRGQEGERRKRVRGRVEGVEEGSEGVGSSFEGAWRATVASHLLRVVMMREVQLWEEVMNCVVIEPQIDPGLAEGELWREASMREGQRR